MTFDYSSLLTHTYFRGRVAMSAILRAHGVGRGDDVLIQAFTCQAVPEGVISTGARPVYVDIETGGTTMDPDHLLAQVTPRTRAVVVQHTFGAPADMTRITGAAKRHGLLVVEDCAHALGSEWEGRAVGSWGDAAFFSFEASKPLFAGLGGAAVANDPELDATLAAQHSDYAEPSAALQLQIIGMALAHSVLYRPKTYWAVRRVYRAMVKRGLISGNYNNNVALDRAPAADFSRAMGSAQRGLLRRAVRDAVANIGHRRRVGERLAAGITSARVNLPPLRPLASPVYARFPLFVEDRDALLAAAALARVELADFYNTPVHGVPLAQSESIGYVRGSCPNAEFACRRIVSLPTNRHMTDAVTDRAIEFINRAA